MSFTEKIVVGKISFKVMHSFKVMPVIYQIKSFVVALFSVKPMNSVNLMSVKVMHDCIHISSVCVWGAKLGEKIVLG